LGFSGYQINAGSDSSLAGEYQLNATRYTNESLYVLPAMKAPAPAPAA